MEDGATAKSRANGSRIVAGAVVLAGIALLAWVGLRSPDGGDTAADAAIVQTDGAETADTPDSASTQAGEAGDSGASASTDPASNATEPEPAAEAEPTATPVPDFPEPENYGPRRQLVNLDGWLNTDTISTLDDLDGKVVLVEMWTFGCYNCKARIPYNQSYYEQFSRDDFEMVGVHAPEFSYEADVANIEQALVDLGVTWPVALDTSKKNFRSWQEGTTSYWPRTYVIDQNGDIRYDHIGEGKYEKLRSTIQHLIENPPAPASDAEPAT